MTRSILNPQFVKAFKDGFVGAFLCLLGIMLLVALSIARLFGWRPR